MTLEELLAQQAGQGVGPIQPTDVESLLAQQAASGAQVTPKAPPTVTQTALDSGNAIGTGFWRGAARLAGVPVDTVQNVIDLGKAVVGAPYIAITGKAPPDALQIKDRSGIVGSGDNIIAAARKTEPGKLMLDAQNPDYQGGYLQNAGSGLTAAVAGPLSWRQALNQAVLGLAGSTGGKFAYDKTGNPALAVAASLSPLGAQQAVSAGAKYAVRGGGEGRQQMAQRVQDLQNAGVQNPTLGLASGNPTIGGAENILQNTPGAVKIMQKARADAVAGLQQAAEDAANTASPVRGAATAGTQIQNDLNGLFNQRISPTYETLNNRVVSAIGPQTPVPIANTLAKTGQLSTPDPGAPATSGMLIPARITQLNDALNADVAANQGIPYESLKNQRTAIGAESRSAPLDRTPEGAKFKQVYGAMSQDMVAAAQAADRNNGVPAGVIGPTEQALQRANNYYSAAMDRVDTVKPFANAGSPEQAYTGLMNTTGEKNTILQAVKKSVSPDTRGTIAGTVIDRLGRATPGNQNNLSDVFSPDTFLTNWNRMTPKARDELFSGFPNSDQVKARVEAVAKATSLMKDNSKMWSNPSGTAANAAARATLGTIGVGGLGAGLGLMNPWLPIGAAGGVGAANLAAGALTSPRAIDWALSPNYLSPSVYGAQFNTLFAPGLMPFAKQPE